MQLVGDGSTFEDLRARATDIASAWGATAALFTSIGQERAILRLFGVTGVDRAGRPLAAEVVSRYLGPELGKWYAENNPSTSSSVVVRLRPERWITCDFGKMMG